MKTRTIRDTAWADLGTTVTCPKVCDEVDYLIAYFAKGDDFFSKMDAVQKGLASNCLLSSSYVRGDVERTADFWALSNGQYAGHTFYIQSPYIHSGNQSLFAGALYPYRYNATTFSTVMGFVAKRLDSSAGYRWNQVSPDLIDVIYDGETRTYGGQGSGKGQGIEPDQIMEYYTFGDDLPGITITGARDLLKNYAKLEVPDDLPKEEPLTWDTVCDTVGNGAWVRLVGIDTLHDQYKTSYAYLYDTGAERSINAEEFGAGGSHYLDGTMGYASDAWVDGRYVDDHNIWEPGATFADHKKSDILLTDVPFPEFSYQYDDSTETFYNIKIRETSQNVRFRYDETEDLWKPASESMDPVRYKALGVMASDGQIDEKYLDMVQITTDEIDALKIDRNTDTEPEKGYIYDGTCEAGTAFGGNDLPYPLGDVNEDDSVNASDAADILIAAAHLGAGETDSGLNEEQQMLADVNTDGNVTAEDAAIILQYAAAVGATNYSGTIEEFQKQ